MTQMFFCAICTHTKQGLQAVDLTVINGIMVCEVHMIYLEGSDFTSNFNDILAEVRKDMDDEL